MEINRSGLLASLAEFVDRESGVIIGIPGVGKSHILSQLVVGLVEKNNPACLVKLDNLTTGSDEDIANNLGMPDANWITNLKEIPKPTQGRAAIIFDAFDTLRDENLKEIVLTKIAEVKKELPDWAVIVSVRTYDAHQSQKLLELFPGGLTPDGLDCRKFIIPELTDLELQQFLAENERLKALYDIANHRLQDIFKIPFYLKLLNFIIDNEVGDLNSLSVIKSEIELLDRYWSKVVGNIKPVLATEVVMKKLTSVMIDIRQLSIDKYDFLEKLTRDEILIIDRLLSENVLKAQGVTQGQLSYSHNILFDYGVSKLIIKGSAKAIVDFIEEDPARPLFLRPSFIYFFTRLWYQARPDFWAIYEELLTPDNENLRLFNKLIPPAIIVREFEFGADVIWANDGTPQHRKQIQDILQGFRYLKSRAPIDEKALLLEILSKNLQMDFVGDFALLLNKTLEDKTLNSSEKAFSSCGTAARNFLNYCLLHRNDEGKNLEPLIAYHAVPVVAKTFASDLLESKKYLTEILATIKVPGFNIRAIASLVGELKSIYLHDPEFVGQIYQVVFNHEETEDVPTIMHASILTTFTSNRRDEIQSCHYRLKSFFPTVLKTYPDQAIPLALDIFDAWVNKKNSDGIIINPAFTIPTDMIVNGVAVRYRVDMSHYWGDMANYNDEFTVLKQVFKYFDELIGQDEIEKLKGLIKVYVSQAHNASEWAALLEWAATHAVLIHNELFELLLQAPILYWSDTMQQAAGFLEQAAVFLQPEQLKLFEDAIMNLSSYVPESEQERVALTIFRLLSRIPKDQLQREDTKALFKDKEPAANDPLLTFSSTSEPYTTRMFLQDEGVDVNDPITDGLLNAEQTMAEFSNAYNGRLPDADTYKNVLEIAFENYDKIRANPDLPEDVVSSSLKSIAEICVIVLKSDRRAKYVGEAVSTDYAKISAIILDCLSRHTSSDTYAEEHYSPGSIYSSTPKSAAAAGIVELYCLTGDESLLPLIEQLSIDKNPIARFHVQQSVGALYDFRQDLFWQIVMDRLKNETDNFAWGQIISRLDRKSIFEKEQTKLIEAFKVAQVRVINVTQNSDFFNNFLTLSLNFIRLNDNTEIKGLLLKSVSENPLVTHNLIWSVLELIQPENPYRNLKDAKENEESQRLVDLLLAILDECEKTILNTKEDPEPKPEVEQAFKALNQTVMRIYFSLQINKRINQPGSGKIIVSKEDQQIFYGMVKPLLERTALIAEKIGFMQGPTAHYFIEILGTALDFDAEYALSRMRKITEMTIATGYIQDRSGIEEAVKFTEKLLGNHRSLLTDPTAFAHIKAILELYATAGWPEALNLLWQLDDIFR